MAAVLILTGFMGSGKTAVGRSLANKLDWDFFDADPLIEQRLGMSIPEIFKERGEPAFRQAEAAVIAGLLDEACRSGSGVVVSLGGGAVTTPAIYERLLQEPLVVFLDEDIDTAYERARGGHRPLADDRESFGSLFSERESLYRSVARYIVHSRGLEVAQVADRVIQLIHERTGSL